MSARAGTGDVEADERLQDHARPDDPRPDDTRPDDVVTEVVEAVVGEPIEDEPDGVRLLDRERSRLGGFKGALADIVASVARTHSRERLPRRVLASIDRNDGLSEVLVRLSQFAIFATWGALYLFAPKPESMFASQVPVAIGFYLATTLVLLWWGTRRRLPSWFVYLSITVDMALLAVLIWTFHLQYAQPPAFYLKDPAMLNFMLLIALRALRFEARYVIAAGIAAAISWTVLVLYAIYAPPVWPVTTDYVTYVTSNRVLVGAEATRVVAILMFTAILALSVRRANTFLVNAILQANAADELSRFFPDVVAQKVRNADHEIAPGEGERRAVAILNVDIRGFTELSSTMAPGRTVSLLSEYQSLIIPVIRDHDGLIDKFMGDGIMATFGTTDERDVDESRGDEGTPDPSGTPFAAPTFAADALRAVDGILHTVDAHVSAHPDDDVASLDVNYAVVAGPVVFGTVGDEERLEYTVIGPSVNLSAKLEKHNKVLGSRALTDRATWELALEQGFDPAAARVIAREPRIVQTQVTGTDAVIDCVVLA